MQSLKHWLYQNLSVQDQSRTYRADTRSRVKEDRAAHERNDRHMKEVHQVPGITIRDYRLEDYESVLRLWTEAGLPFRPLGRDSQESLTAELLRERAVFLLAEAEGPLVGVILGTHDGRKAWINRLAVVPAFRRRGIARLLVRAVETRMVALGLDITAALIESDNQVSLRFFREIGYVHDPRIEYVSRRRSSET